MYLELEPVRAERLARELRGENVIKGRDMLEKEAKRRGVTLPALTKPEYYEGILKRYAFSELDDIYGAVGYGGIASAYVVSRLLEEQRKAETPALPKVQEVTHEEAQRQLGKPSHGVYVKGESGMLVRFARCCNPVPGDEIIGYITRGRGVTVHKADCINATNSEQERMVEVSWADTDASTTFNASINIIAYDHVSLLGELALYIGNMDVPIVAVSAKRDEKKKTSNIVMVIQVKSREQLDRVLGQLHKRSDIVEVYRAVT